MWQYWIIPLCWLIFLAYWAVSALHVKKDIMRGGTWHATGIWIRIIIICAIIASFTLRAQGVDLSWANRFYPVNGTVLTVGTVLCVLGIALAIWARWHLGRNWSPRPSLKEHHELVTSGPYAVVRHPIYTGLVFATFGSLLTAGSLWLLVWILLLVMFVLRVYSEEEIMGREFPQTYPAYKKRTKALIPFIW